MANGWLMGGEWMASRSWVRPGGADRARGPVGQYSLFLGRAAHLPRHSALRELSMPHANQVHVTYTPLRRRSLPVASRMQYLPIESGREITQTYRKHARGAKQKPD